MKTYMTVTREVAFVAHDELQGDVSIPNRTNVRFERFSFDRRTPGQRHNQSKGARPDESILRCLAHTLQTSEVLRRFSDKSEIAIVRAILEKSAALPSRDGRLSKSSESRELSLSQAQTFANLQNFIGREQTKSLADCVMANPTGFGPAQPFAAGWTTFHWDIMSDDSHRPGFAREIERVIDTN